MVCCALILKVSEMCGLQTLPAYGVTVLKTILS